MLSLMTSGLSAERLDLCGSLHLFPFKPKLIRSSMRRCVRTWLGDVSYCSIIFSQDEYFWCIFKLRAPPLFSLHPSLHSYFYSLFRLGRASSFAGHWPAFFVLASEFLNPRLRSWYSELTQRQQIKHWIIIVFFSSILRCLFIFCGFYLVYFRQLLFRFQSSLCFFSLVSGLLNLHCHPSPIIPLVVVWLLPWLGLKQPSQNSVTISDPHSSDWSRFWHRRAASLCSQTPLREEKLETGF